jgi:hypothetical protein
MKNYFRLSFAICTVLFIVNSAPLYSQTPGTFNFTVTTASSGGNSPSHLLAIWIENGSASFIKTKIKYSSPSNYDHLSTWTSKSGLNVVDATTGSTLTSHGTITFLWNGTDVSGNPVTDGSYKVWLEMAWGSTLKTVNSYPFTIGPSLFNSSPANTTNFLNMGLTWTPSGTTGIEPSLFDENIVAYPNPTSGLLKINFKKPYQDCLLQVINESGASVYNENLGEVSPGEKIINLNSLESGVYFVKLHLPIKDIIFSIIIMK